MQYSLSISKTALLAEITAPNGAINETIGISIVPDCAYLLQTVNRESAIPLDNAAVTNFTQLFLLVAHAEGYEPGRIHAALDSYIKDTEYLLGIGVQKVHQAFTLRTLLLSWLEITRCFIGYAALEMQM